MHKTQKQAVPKFGDVYEKPQIDLKGERISADHLLNQEIIIREYRKLPSKFGTGEYALVQVEWKSKYYVFSTGSGVVLDQLDKIKEKLPVKATLTKPKRYYKLA